MGIESLIDGLAQEMRPVVAVVKALYWATGLAVVALPLVLVWGGALG